MALKLTTSSGVELEVTYNPAGMRKVLSIQTPDTQIKHVTHTETVHGDTLQMSLSPSDVEHLIYMLRT